MSNNEEKITYELERILDEFKDKISLANEGLLKTIIAEKFINEKMKELNNLFPENSKIQLKYQKLKEDRLPTWRKEVHSTFINEEQPLYRELLTIQDILKELLKDCDPAFQIEHISTQNNFYFSKGDIFDSKRLLIKILKSAKKTIVIIDPYIDDIIFDYIEIVDSMLDIKILTSFKVKNIIIQLFKNLKSSRPNIQVRQSEHFHDRFIIIDEKEVWHLGTSINSIGKKAFQINRLATENEINKILIDSKNWWQKGNLVI